MQLQLFKPNRPSRPVIPFQMRASNMKQNQNIIENPKHHQHHHSHSNMMNVQIETLFDSKTGLLNPSYCDKITKYQHKAMMSIGVCLSNENITLFFKLMHNQLGRAIHGINKVTQRKQIHNEIYYITSINYKIQNCTIVYWIIQDIYLKQLLQSNKNGNQLLDIFIIYPQIIIVDSYIIQLTKYQNIYFNKLFKFEQNIIYIGNLTKQKYEYINKYEQNKYKVYFINNIDLTQIKYYILLTLKKNSIRCFNQSLKINFYVLESFNAIHSKQQHNPSNQNHFISIFQLAASKYLSQVQRQYDLFSQSIKNREAKNEKQLQYELNEYEDLCMREIRKNIHILSLSEEQQKYFQPVQKVINVNNHQILSNNRQLIKKQNNQLLEQLYQKLINQFDKGRYNNTKQRVSLMANDLQSMMKQYEKRAIKSNILFNIFNTFIRNNRNKYYEKIQEIQQRMDHNKKNQNFDEIFDKIEIKKKVLITLQKQVKNLQNKKNIIQKQNQHLKKLQKQLNQRANFQSDDQQIVQADSIKTMRNKPIKSQSSNKNQSNVVLSTLKNKNKLKTQKLQKKNKCLQRCQII